MFRDKSIPLWALPLLLWFLTGGAHAAQRTLALLLGDVESRPAVLAVRTLQTQLQALDVAVRIIPANGMMPADRAALRSADVVVVNVLGQQLV